MKYAGIFFPLVSAAGLTLLSACNTVEGVGRDIERAGDAIQDEADDAQDRRVATTDGVPSKPTDTRSASRAPESRAASSGVAGGRSARPSTRRFGELRRSFADEPQPASWKTRLPCLHRRSSSTPMRASSPTRATIRSRWSRRAGCPTSRCPAARLRPSSPSSRWPGSARWCSSRYGGAPTLVRATLRDLGFASAVDRRARRR